MTVTAAQAHAEQDTGRQSLTIGEAAEALPAIERACAGTARWSTAHVKIRRIATGPIDNGDHAGLYYGAPAVTFLLHAAATADPRYRAAATSLDPHLHRLARRRLHAAIDRIHRRKAATFAEYDLFYGLTGIAALLLRRAPGSDTLTDLLQYLVTLTEPTVHDNVRLPGWWVDHDPDPALPTPGGHANLGMAHGAAGILALLSLAARHGHTVDHHADAIGRLTDWFDRWRQHDEQGDAWWPQWLTLDELRAGRTHQPRPGLPSWCYGSPGIGRALHLAAIATNDSGRQADAEHILASCADRRHHDRLADPGLCHGRAGLYQTLFRAAADARSPAIAQRLPALAEALTDHTATPTTDRPRGMLTGSTGVDLAIHTARHGTPHTGWDACLLII